MWFKQFQLFELTKSVQSSANALAKRLEPLHFQPCPATMPSSSGWVTPVDEDDAPLAVGINGCIMICLQIEEKILPTTVITQALTDKVKLIEGKESRKLRQKEKLNLKDELVYTLLPRAFTKLTRLYAYIDTRNHWVVLNTTNANKTSLFLSTFKKSLGDIIDTYEIVKPAAILTRWLGKQDYPKEFAIEKTCVLQDPQQENRVIRARQQDLFAPSIQALIKDGCEVIQLGLCWQDRISFILSNQFVVQGVKLTEDDLANIKDESETKLQKLTADFVIMTEMLTGLLNDLLASFTKQTKNEALARTG